MKTISKTALVALLTASVGLTAIAPVWAQETPSPAPLAAPATPDAAAKTPIGRGFGLSRPGPRAGGDVFNLERGAESVEIALVRLGYRLELTADQQALLETLKTSAIAAAEDFAATTENLRPARPAAGETPDFAARLDSRIALEKARLAALEAIQPAANAFFDSLSAEQQAQLTPQRRDANRDRQRGNAWQQGRPGQMPGFGQHGPRHRAPAPDNAPETPETPAAPQG